jgi:hypothetical protein
MGKVNFSAAGFFISGKITCSCGACGELFSIWMHCPGVNLYIPGWSRHVLNVKAAGGTLFSTPGRQLRLDAVGQKVRIHKTLSHLI